MSTKEKALETTIVLKDETLALAAKLEEGFAIDKKTGVITETSDLYEINLPEALTMQAVKEVSDYNATFVAAGTVAFGRMAVDAMKGHKDLQAITGEFKMGVKDKLSMNIERSKEYTNHLSGNGEKTIKFGVTTTTYEVRAGKNAGQLKAARAMISEMATSKLKK